MDVKKVLADFQFAGNRISKFSIETKDIDTKGKQAKLTYNIDYRVIDVKQDQSNLKGVLEFTVEIKAKIDTLLLFKIALTIEGIFMGNSQVLDTEKFTSMLELNGTATLSQIARSYITSTTALSGLNPPIKLPMINTHVLKQMKEKEAITKH